jgi:hypothetical protein
MDHPKGADDTGDFRLGFDRRVRLEFFGSKISSDGADKLTLVGRNNCRADVEHHADSVAMFHVAMAPVLRWRRVERRIRWRWTLKML